MANENQNTYKNMQHAIVEALHELGQISPYNDESVRMKELFSKVEKAPIEVNGKVDTGPHRFSIFNSALTGRRSAPELFERIEDTGRQGAWWRLKKPYEEAIEFALEQKSFKQHHQRARTRNEIIPETRTIKPQEVFNWNKSNILDILTRIQQFATRTSDLRDENRELEERLSQLTDEISQLKKNSSSDILQMLETYKENLSHAYKLRDQLFACQKRLTSLSDSVIETLDK